MNTDIVKKGIPVALIVGTILLVINQYDGLLGNTEIRLLPAILTYCVPFVVFCLGHISSTKQNL